MSFGISNNVRSREVRTCTRELFLKAVRSDYVARVCAGIADAWEQWKRGELAREEYDTVKNREKRRLPIFTFHATFPGGRRLNADAVPTGLSMYDIDHLDAPREYFAHVVEERTRELGIVLAHVTPSMECPEAYELAKKLREENAEFARLSQSRVYENLSFRANVIAYLKACVLYVAQGCTWDRTLEDFVRWSLEYDLWCKMEFFGEAIGQAMTLPPAQSNKPGPRNLLELLPDEFTRTDAERARQSEGLDAKGTSHMLSQWKSRGYISIVSNLNYRKLKYRSDGIDLTTPA